MFPVKPSRLHVVSQQMGVQQRIAAMALSSDGHGGASLLWGG